MRRDDRFIAFGLELRRRRKARNVTLAELSASAGITPNYLGSIENGQRDPSMVIVLRIADALGVPLDELFGRATVSAEALDQARMIASVPAEIRTPLMTAMVAIAEGVKRAH